MFINGVKVTLIICLTIVVTCVLCISYSEYLNRYSIISTNDNNVYIFDKKSTIMNRCNQNGCEVIETKLPSTSNTSNSNTFLNPSKLFDKNHPMTSDVVVSAKPENQQQNNNTPNNDNTQNNNNNNVINNDNNNNQNNPPENKNNSNPPSNQKK